MLLGNYSVINKLPGRFFAGNSVSCNRSNWNTTNSSRNIYISHSPFDKINGVPVGYVNKSWILPQSSGGITTNSINLVTVNNLNLAGGVTTTSTLEGLDTITTANLNAIVFTTIIFSNTSSFVADIGGLVPMDSSILGENTFIGDAGSLVGILASLSSDSDLSGLLGKAVSISSVISGVNDLTGELESIVVSSITSTINGINSFSADTTGVVELAITLQGQDNIVSDAVGIWDMNSDISNTSGSSITIKSLAHLLASITSSNSISINPNALPAFIDVDISSQTELSPSNLAEAVWDKSIEGSINAKEILKLLSSIAAGKTTITDLGDGAAQVIFRDINDLKNRITAGMTNSERHTITKDLS